MRKHLNNIWSHRGSLMKNGKQCARSNFVYFSYICLFYFIFFVFPPVWLPALYISLTLFPFPSPSLPYPLSLPSVLPELPPWECDRSHSLLCCIAFARGHRETAENLCWYSRPCNRVCPQSNSLWKMTSRSAFRCAGLGPAVTHSSTDSAISFLLSHHIRSM